MTEIINHARTRGTQHLDKRTLRRDGRPQRQRVRKEANDRLELRIAPIEATLEQKITAVLAYASQMAELAHSQLGRPADPDEAGTIMAAALREFARTVGGESGAAERVYSLPAQRG